jgi:MYXO-CTERM domain-containing protein
LLTTACRSLTAALVLGLLFGVGLCGVGLFGTTGTAHAFETYALTLIPNRAYTVNASGQERPCITCHDNPDGGAGCAAGTAPCLNLFGMAFQANGKVWNEALAMADADGDGYTNGEELVDPTGEWRPADARGCATAADCGAGFECRNNVCNHPCASRPGFATFTPADADADDDGFCCRGRDTNNDGMCTGVGENDGSFDCNPTDDTVASGLPELCTDAIDNNCNGEPTLTDVACATVVDRDGDGFCPMGRDNNRDNRCTGAGEMTADIDCNDTAPTIYPGARENCIDGLDNDCNNLIDALDPMCTSDVDEDDDGFCPIGADLNSNGHCNDPGEREAGFDCDDMDDEVNPGQTEQCGDGVDNDCNGLVDFRDPVCAAAFDNDEDGYCPTGQDTNGDQDCADPGEDLLPSDCDDEDPLVNPGRMELCENTIDDNCDGTTDLADMACEGYHDRDGDRYCVVGFDMNRDGVCLGMEVTGAGDCDDADLNVNPTIAEVCTDGVDNDCDGVADAADRADCDEYNDHDLDGYCLVGRDMNDDGDCSDEGEQSGPTEVPGPVGSTPPESYGTDNDPTVYPGAPENCRDMKDNDLNGIVDDPEYCTREMDHDGDGYCPIGQDLNDDGDCLDADENQGVTDCNEMDPTINPGAEERCFELIDADCDGRWQTMDTDCFVLLDRDGDGFCGTGIDDNGDGDCTDSGEDRFGMDCDDMNSAVNPRARENCTDGIDNDCDGAIDLVDTQCTCASDAECDDLDSCTVDECIEMACVWTPDSTCGDAGPAPDGGTDMPDDGCSCRGASDDSGALPSIGALLAIALFVVRRRKRT